jgi:glycosyltransferase involved in cell wall biosynthesis
VWLSAETPVREGSGGQHRQFHQIRQILGSGIDVYVATLAGPQDDSSIRGITPGSRFSRPRWDRLLGRSSRELGATLDHLGVTAAVAHVKSLPHVQSPLEARGIPWALDFQNVNSRWHAALGDDSATTLWRRREADALEAATFVTCCSEEERTALRAVQPSAEIEVLSNGVDPSEWPAEAIASERRKTVAMFGTWTHQPNRDGLDWFLASVWPRVTAEAADARLLVIGPGEPPVRTVASRGVEVVGRVDNLAALLGTVAVIAVPIIRGMGARMKFGEALASGAAVVSTPLGAEGANAGGHFISASDENAFSSACLELLHNPQKAHHLGDDARDWVLHHLTWARTCEPLVQWCGDIGR